MVCLRQIVAGFWGSFSVKLKAAVVAAVTATMLVVGSSSGAKAVVYSFNNVALSDGGFLNAIYQDALNRQIDSNGAVSHAQVQSSGTVVGLDGPLSGLTATRQNGQLAWSNGAVWNNFDFNALNAFFEMATGYP